MATLSRGRQRGAVAVSVAGLLVAGCQVLAGIGDSSLAPDVEDSGSAMDVAPPRDTSTGSDGGADVGTQNDAPGDATGADTHVPTDSGGDVDEGGDAPGDAPADAPADTMTSPPLCEAGTPRCGGALGNVVQSCDADGGWVDGTVCAAMCSAGACVTPPSCGSGTTSTCGAGGNQSCCAATAVAGGDFDRSYDAVTATDPSYKASVSTFVLDVFEVTVGRFRNFANSYTIPSSGAGKNPNNPTDPGWNATWPLPATSSAVETEVACSSGTWTSGQSTNELKPITCVDWYTAFAFCIWDGGRLPTEAEWDYAAAGGGGATGQRVYPWSSPSTSMTIDATHAIFGVSAAAAVGSTSPNGNGAWGQVDMAGNAEEWVLDWYASQYSSTACADCADTAGGTDRGLRGGNFEAFAGGVTASVRDYALPANVNPGNGFRCARTFR